MTETTQSGPLMAADGTPLKARLARAMRVSRLRAFGLVAPLLAFIFCFFFLPIAYLLFQAVYNPDYSSNMPRTTEVLQAWDGKSDPDETFYSAVVADLIQSSAIDRARPTVAATRLNREKSGALSKTKKLMRQVRKLKLTYEGEELAFSRILSKLHAEDDNRQPIYSDAERSAFGSELAEQAVKLHAPFREMVVKSDDDWADPSFWRAAQQASQTYTGSFILKALDLKFAEDGGITWQPETVQIHLKLFVRTLEISLIVTILTLLLGYPIAYLLAQLPVRTSNLLLILVLLPFWTSILVRTTAWIAILQGQGVLNDIFVFVGIADDEQRFSMIYNKLGTLIAMTHILLPFMVLPLYSVMKAIPPSYVRAAKSLGATNWTAFWRIYFPQTIPGIGAGAILVFILAIGYYITPALLGGSEGVMISNIIDGHMRSSLNYSLAAALGLVLLVFVLFCYWIYDRIVGIDNMKLG
jgi:putative spermidine/putrescine transport system permease protein